MILKGSTLWRSSSPTLVLKQDYLNQNAEDHAQFILQGQISHNCSRKFSSVSNPPHGEKTSQVAANKQANQLTNKHKILYLMGIKASYNFENNSQRCMHP